MLLHVTKMSRHLLLIQQPTDSREGHLSVDITMAHSLQHLLAKVVLPLLVQHVVNCDTSVLHKTSHFHHQPVVVVVEVMLEEDFPSAFPP